MMIVLRYQTEDYEVLVMTDDISYSWSNFKGRINYRNQITGCDSDPMSYCVYTAKDNVDFYIYNPDTPKEAEKQDISQKFWPVVYETNKYQIIIKFRGLDNGTKPKVIHILKEVEKCFLLDVDSNGSDARLTGVVDFLNQPGLFKLNFEYQINGRKKESYITFDVVSPKLDTKHDYKKILNDVNQEFEELVFNYLSTTFQQFGKGREKNLEVWMQVFQQVVSEYLKNVERVIKNPHSKVRTIQLFDKADRIKHWTPAMEEEYAETKAAGELEEHYFEHNQYDNTVNSMENRFVKYTLKQIGGKLDQVFSKLLTKGNQDISTTKGNQDISTSYINEWEDFQHKIKKYQKHPFFKSVGKFEGLRQESLVLQSRMGYQQVYKDWLKLKKGIDFYEGATNIGTLQIWEIYELWCFIKVKSMVRQLMGFDPNKKDSEYGDLISEPNGTLIQYSGDKKIDYRIKFIFPTPDEPLLSADYQFKDLLSLHQGEEVTLHYQHTFNRRSEDDFNVQTVTTEQRPDIVLNIKKCDGFVLTYLYDAKYRVWGDKNLDQEFELLDQEEQKKMLDEENQELSDSEKKLYGADYPPSDAINQMHRYRDAIYYGLDSTKRPDSKEIIGGYILFPGRGDDKHIKERYFSKSISTVNIGAFPLLPLPGNLDDQGRDVEGPQLWEHLKDVLLVKETPYKHVEASVPQRGLFYTPDAEVSILHKWEHVKVLLFTDIQTSHWDRIDSYQYLALGLDPINTMFSLGVVKEYSDVKYIAVVSSEIPGNKKTHLYKVEGSSSLSDSVDDSICLKRNYYSPGSSGGVVNTYLQYKLNKNQSDDLKLNKEKIHTIQGGSHNPKLVMMNEIID